MSHLVVHVVCIVFKANKICGLSLYVLHYSMEI